MTSGAFISQLQDEEAFWKNLPTRHPDETTRAELRYLELASMGPPPFHAGDLRRVLNFKEMVAEASYLLFDKSTPEAYGTDNLNRLEFGPVPTETQVWEASFVKFRLERYLNGYCLNCESLIEHAGRDGEPGKEGQRILRRLLGLFDRTGEPIPLGLRRWSQESRFRKPPGRPTGKPNQNWLRDIRIIHTVATLAYLTGRDPGRNREAGDRKSCCDAVARAFRARGFPSPAYAGVETVWNEKDEGGIAPGPAKLERWRGQDQEVTRTFTPQQRDSQRARAERRWARLPYWRSQAWWDGS